MLNSFENSEAYDETEYLLSSCTNKVRLLASHAQAQHGDLIPLDGLSETANEILKARSCR